MSTVRVRDTGWRSPPVPDLRQAVEQAAEGLAESVRERTLAGRDVHGTRFAPKRDGSPSTLRKTGRMVQSFRPQRVDDRSATLAPGRSEAARAYIHQAGARGLPARPWVGVDDRMANDARDTVRRALEKR